MINATQVARDAWPDGYERLAAIRSRLSLSKLKFLGNGIEGLKPYGGACLPISGLMYITPTTVTTSAIRKIIPTLRVRRIIVITTPNKNRVVTSPKEVIIIIAKSTPGFP